MHYCIAVLGNNPEETIAKYDEQLSGVFLKPKEQFIKETRVYNKWYKKNFHDVYIADPEEYRKKHSRAKEVHFDHVLNFMDIFNMTDDEIMEKEYASHEADNEDEPNQSSKSDCGGIYIPYNHLGKWDWYQIGGRWPNMLNLKEPGTCKAQGEASLLFDPDTKANIQKEKEKGLHCDSALVKDIDWKYKEMKDFSCYGLVLENGDWYDKDYCIIDGKYEEPLTDKEMEEFFAEIIDSLPDTTQITIIDIHA